MTVEPWFTMWSIWITITRLRRLKERLREWVDYYNNHRYHEAINNVTPADKYFDRDKEVLKNRLKINKLIMLADLPNEINWGYLERR